MADSTLGGVVAFLTRFGLFDVVLPFLLVFTIVYAVLEKTRILGTEGEKKLPKSNLNGMVAFVFGLTFIAAQKLVQALNVALPYVVLMLVMFICILLLVAAFYKEGEFDFFHNYSGMKQVVLWVVIVGVLSAFLYAIGWAEPVIGMIANNWDSTVVASIFFGAMVIGLIWFIVKTPKEEGAKAEKK